MRIENWSIFRAKNSSYVTPSEVQTRLLYGQVFGHPGLRDGEYVSTSSICGKNDKDEVITASGSSYELGKIDPSYEKIFPGAKDILLSSLILKDCNTNWLRMERRIRHVLQGIALVSSKPNSSLWRNKQNLLFRLKCSLITIDEIIADETEKGNEIPKDGLFK